MPPTTIRSAPSLDSFTSLEDHQSQTPASFYGSKPVLYHHIVGAGILIPSIQRSKLPIFYSVETVIDEGTTGAQLPVVVEGATVHHGSPPMGDIAVDVYVSSE
jgi:hypothetical protein